MSGRRGVRIPSAVELFGISPTELMVIAFVAVIVFGQRLPQVAGEAAATVQKIRRALNDLRRDSGIDQEIRNARREIDQSVVRPFREADIGGAVHREVRAARSELETAQQAPRAPETASSTPAELPSAPPATPDEVRPPLHSDPRSDPNPG